MKQVSFLPDPAPEYKRRTFGLCWYSGTAQGGRGAGWRPFTDWQEITRGKNAGKIKVVYASGKTRIIRHDQVRSWPEPAL